MVSIHICLLQPTAFKYLERYFSINFSRCLCSRWTERIFNEGEDGFDPARGTLREAPSGKTDGAFCMGGNRQLAIDLVP